MTNFIYLYNFNGKNVLYSLLKNGYDLIYYINLYFNKQTILPNYNTYIIVHFTPENNLLEFINNKNIILLQSDIQFELFFYLQLLRHNYFYKNKITNTNEIFNLWNDISVPFDKYPNMIMYSRKDMFINNLNADLNICDETINIIKKIDKTQNLYSDIIEYKPIEKIEYYNTLLDKINTFLTKNVEYFNNGEVNFKEYSVNYIFKKSHIIYNSFISKNITLENVYYMNKCWFDKNRQPLLINDFNIDFEYRQFIEHFENKNFNKNIDSVSIYQEVTEEVMFLDYIYGFYNFGEFWDVIKRLLISNVKNLPLFHLTHNRITNIEYYFNKLEYKYPTNYQKRERENKLYYFHKINISTISGTFRGAIDNYFGYHFNKLFNQTKICDKSYNIYLARSNFGRNIQDEEKIVNVLKEKYNFIVLDGKETLEETMHYFTNAKIILGAHGSLIKNMIWAKKNPVLIELCPPTRHDCFYGNAQGLGFFPLFILTDTNEKEEIILNDKQKGCLFKLLDILKL
jgi:hypothetical protein